MSKLQRVSSFSGLFLTLALGSLSSLAQADTLLIDRVKRETSISMPHRGMSMDSVISSFGEPEQRLAAVGGESTQHPPITRWVYANFTVYFEHSHVVNAVANRSNELEQGPKPIH